MKIRDLGEAVILRHLIVHGRLGAGAAISGVALHNRAVHSLRHAHRCKDPGNAGKPLKHIGQEGTGMRHHKSYSSKKEAIGMGMDALRRGLRHRRLKFFLFS